MESNPGNPYIMDTMGWVYYQKGLYTKAISLFESSIKKNDKDPRSFYHLGMAYLKNKDSEKAKSALRKALDLGTDFPEKDLTRKTLGELG